MQSYVSVEYIDSQDIVRFGTHGRGTWDFDISSCQSQLLVNGTVPTGTYDASVKVTSGGQVPNGNIVNYYGGNCVELQAGFQVDAGATFVGDTQPCN